MLFFFFFCIVERLRTCSAPHAARRNNDNDPSFLKRVDSTERGSAHPSPPLYTMMRWLAHRMRRIDLSIPQRGTTNDTDALKYAPSLARLLRGNHAGRRALRVSHPTCPPERNKRRGEGRETREGELAGRGTGSQETPESSPLSVRLGRKPFWTAKDRGIHHFLHPSLTWCVDILDA